MINYVGFFSYDKYMKGILSRNHSEIYYRIRKMNEMKSFGKLYCPKCLSLSGNVYSTLNGDPTCGDCHSKFDFKDLLSKDEVRDLKIDNILS